MLILRRLLKFFFVLVVLAAPIWGFFRYYSYIFSKNIHGKIEKVERIDINVALMQSVGVPTTRLTPALFSFAVAIKTSSGEIYTSSAQDRQWAVAKEGQCVEAKFYPYPFWDLEKAGTFFNARLLRLYECPQEGAVPANPTKSE
jgi:hypothetical protein